MQHVRLMEIQLLRYSEQLFFKAACAPNSMLD